MAEKKKLIIVGIIVTIAMGYLIYSGFQNSMVYYYTVSEVDGKVASASGENMRVSGLVSNGSIHKDPDDRTVRFVLTEGGKSLPVVYRGIVPDTLKDGNGVVAEGFLNSSGFLEARSIVTKCPSKYIPEK